MLSIPEIRQISDLELTSDSDSGHNRQMYDGNNNNIQTLQMYDASDRQSDKCMTDDTRQMHHTHDRHADPFYEQDNWHIFMNMTDKL